MNAARRRSIASRMLINTCFVTGIALLSSGIAVTLVDFWRARTAAADALEVQSRIVASNVKAAVAFESPDEAEDVLRAFSADERFLLAIVSDNSGALFASYSRADSAPLELPYSDAGWLSGSITSVQPISIDETQLGSVRVVYDLSTIYQQFWTRMGIQLTVLLVAMGVAVIWSLPLQRRVILPIRRLMMTSMRVMKDGDYSVRAERISNDELGTLTDAFNQMLGQIQSRDRELQQSHAELEDRVQERTRDLEIARQTAEVASRSKSEFLANMSHEIRTPMTSIIGYGELLLEPDQPEEERRHALQTVIRNGKHLLSLINDILDVSKIEAGKMTIEQIECSPAEVLSDVRGLMIERASSKGLVLEVKNEGPIPRTVRSDPTRLRQILVNLIGNAIKFTEHGKIQVILDVVEESASDGVLRFRIVDTGIGMTTEQLGRLFQPFSQADTSTTRKFGGTGLGLMISKRLAYYLGGNLSVSSVLGEGSTFELTIATGDLTKVERVVDWSEQTPSEQAPKPVETADLAALGARVLLAEDGPDNQRLISFVVRRAGAQVAVVENGELAVESAMSAMQNGEPYHVILMDMQMPVMDGYTATKTLRERGYTGPVIALTAHAMSDQRQQCIDWGCDDYLTKPIDRPALIEAIASWVVEPRATERVTSD